MSEGKRHDAAIAVLMALGEHYPNCFSRDSRQRKPLKIGIYDDIIANLPDLDLSALRVALTIYTSCWGYLNACRPGAARVNLAGTECGSVTDDEAAFAKERWAKIHAKIKAKSEARRAAKSQQAKSKPPVSGLHPVWLTPA
jgi:ProP effector